MRVSLDSERPMMAPSTRASVRYSAFSTMAPSLTPTMRSTDSATGEITDINDQLTRLENPKLASQRVMLTDRKVEELESLKLAAKLRKAVDRRLVNQCAVMRSASKSLSTQREVGEEVRCYAAEKPRSTPIVIDERAFAEAAAAAQRPRYTPIVLSEKASIPVRGA